MRTVVGALALVGLLTLTGCIDSHPIPTLPPTPSATPIFASDEDALAAAEDAYRAYLETSNLIANEGGVDPERIAPFVTEDRLKDELRGSAVLTDRKLRTEGSSTFVIQDLQQFDQTQVVVYICWDTSAVRVIDSGGADVTPPDRVDRQLLEGILVVTDGRLPLVLQSDEPWNSESC